MEATAVGMEELTELKNRLRYLTTKWATFVVAEMNKVQPTDKPKLYSILSGNTKDKRWQRIFVEAANKVLQQLQAEYQAA